MKRISFGEPIPIIIATKAMKSCCKIKMKGRLSTGFFMKVSDSLKYLVTTYHLINERMINENVELELWNKKTMKLAFNGRIIKFFDLKDITAIEIKEKDDIYNNIEFLDIDLNYKNGYYQYLNADIFSVQYPIGGESTIASGKILEIDEFEFGHSMFTAPGSAGCPIILLGNVRIIGVHKSRSREKDIGYATFIGEIFNEINIQNKKTNNLQSLDRNKVFINNNNSNININKQLKSNLLDDNHNNISKNNSFNNFNNNSNNNNNYLINKDFNQNNTKNNFIEKRNIEKLLVLTKETKDVITLHFQSNDQSLNLDVRCKNSDKFNIIVNKIFEIEPKYIEDGVYFLCNGNKINEYKTVKDNQLKDGDSIILQTID